ncbi:TonB-dependent receptor [Pseudomaricurvus alkylphenolicus]|uniref:TonB-dependent receptor n=1 Tax=Pseudomaricurvus alkylphenolicus TaxID=1306991 RepID=UPI00141FD122|nr:TonB-dependent receptor [Pseudomaricurvus alkylphenolicus]NIB40129.1 TonB-dependent receptor [Pseudomaricurvus alkylphenolicus]
MAINLRRAIRSINHAALVCGSLSALALSGAAMAQQSDEVAESNQIEEIQVLGIRKSLQASMDVKRFSSSVVDAITSEDIGKFPDKNVAESLARVPGVAISRDFGEGQGVTIRGLEPALNLTLVNGQAVGTAQWFVLSDATRNFNYEMLSPEMVGSVEVYKSAQADIDEGGLGGTVVLKTRKPLDLDSGTVNLSIDAQYGDLSEETDPSFSGLYSWKNEAETFGALVAFSRQERTVRREATELFTPAYFTQFDRDWNADTNPNTPFNAPAGASEQGMIPWGVGSALFEQERVRTGVDVNLQWAPTEALSTNLHYFNSEMEADNVNSNFIGIPFRGIFAANNVSEGTVENGVVTSLAVDGGDPAGWANHVAFDNIYRDGSSMETEIVDLEVDFQGDGFSVHGQIGTTTGEGINNDFFTEFFAHSQDPRVNFDFSNPGGQAPSISYERSPWVSNPTDEMALTGVFDQQNKTEDTEDYVQIDVVLDVDFGAVNELKFGAKMRERSFEQTRFKSEMQGGAPGTESLGWASAFNAGSFTVDHSETSLGSQTFFLPNQSAMHEAFFALPMCSDSGPSLCRPEYAIENASSYKIEEDITSIYAMANFQGDHIRGNVGIRYVDTDTDSSGWDFNNDAPISESGSYDNVLPSVNVVYDLTEDMLLRFAAGKSINRPAPFALSYAVNLTPETSSGTAGNPSLTPTQANQYELGFEWYLSEASMVSATYFNKDISDFVYSTTKSATINGVFINALSTFDNGTRAELEGIELSAQYSFDNGFGVGANYTYTDLGAAQVPEVVDGSLVEREVIFPGTSEDVFNATAYYEGELFTARLNYSYRSEFFKGLQENGELWGDEQKQWDAQVSYNLTDNIVLRAELLNITDEIIEDIYVAGDGTEVKGTQLYNGRRFFVGANFKF